VKARYIVMLCAALLLLSSGPAQAQGYCFNNVAACNDIYFELGSGVGAQTLTGYEYGCGQKDRLVSGTVRIVAGTAYVSLVGTGGLSTVGSGSPYGMVITVNAAVNVSTGSAPTGYWQYHYATGSGANGHGGTSAYSAAPCAPPAGPQPGAPMKPDMFKEQK
jgi:hypothetical protein